MKAKNLRTNDVIEVTVNSVFRNWIYLKELPGKFHIGDGMHNNSISNPTHKLLV